MSTLSLKIENDIAVLALDDGKANVFSPTMMDEFNAALDQAEKANAKCLVIAGRPGRFSAGYDLSIMRTAGLDGVAAMVNQGAHLILRLFDFPMPVVAACTGHAVANGCFALLACDTRVGVKGDFKIGANETAIQMVLPIYGIELAQARLDPRYKTRSVIQAELFSPDDAVSAGYLDEVVEPDALMDRVMEIATQFAALPTEAYTGNKRLIRAETIENIKASLQPL